MPKMSKTEIKEAVYILKNGGVVVYPTETLYGLGALATDKKAVKKIFKIKKRDSNKLLPVIVGSLNQAKRYFVFNKTDLRLARRFWPGPLSLILKTKSKRIEHILDSKYIAVRFSANNLAAAIAKSAGAPITSTSANISGDSDCFTISAVKKQFALASVKPDIYINGGRLKKTRASTIVNAKGSKITILREGKISRKLLETA